LTDEQKLILEKLQYKENGLIPCIVQDYYTRQVLILAYMNEEALKMTLEGKHATFWSRSRQELWTKGETSGNFLTPVRMEYDCDEDALLLEVIPAGPACHTGNTSCFYRTLWSSPEHDTGNSEILRDIEETIHARIENPEEGSYTNYLLSEGTDKICKKVGEEATETVIAAKNEDPEEIASEASDLLYHLAVLLADAQIGYDQLYQVLTKRHGKKSEIKRLGKAKRGEI
jgi:phosphoribosyl-ATP pyrophosphohydrolase/phosphoribosyl-AMP cyclohydrolase